MFTNPQRLAALAFTTFAATASAAPKDDLHDAFATFPAVRPFRATTTDIDQGTQMSTLDYVAPDRYRIKSEQDPTQLIIGDRMYMDMGGTMQRIAVPGVAKMTAQFRNTDFIKQTEAGMQVTALPDATIEDEATRVSACAMTQPIKSDARVRVSTRSGLPPQIESNASFTGIKSNTRMHSSNFDDPSIIIDAPK